jgi:two-component system response regulator WspF
MNIAIVNDVATTAEALRRFVNSEPSYRLAWIAQDGAEAVKKCEQETPDLILMDLMMPVMDGAEATRRIMTQNPCPILVVTSSVDGHSHKIFEALAAGALDVIRTPVIANGGQQEGIATLKFKIDKIGQLLQDGSWVDHARKNGLRDSAGRSPAVPCLIAIGASAGGPGALATILGALPHDFPGAIIIVQHVNAQFGSLMAAWLDERSTISVRLACDGDRPQPNTALMAGTNDHLVFRNSHTLGYTPEPRSCNYRPSIDVLFESALRNWKGTLAGVLLTGMGRDGAKGLKALQRAGSFTIAQDAATCAVYGMPKAAAELNAANQILPVEEIAKALVTFVSSSGNPMRR